MTEQEQRNQGFEIFRAEGVRRISQTHFIVRSGSEASSWRLIELKEGKWGCDCGAAEAPCPHLYATQVYRYTTRQPFNDEGETSPKCRYCGSPDVARCGFRYNSRGISRRFFCHDCQRKFSVPFVRSNPEGKPAEMSWLLNEIGLLMSKLTELLDHLNASVEETKNLGPLEFSSEPGLTEKSRSDSLP